MISYSPSALGLFGTGVGYPILNQENGDMRTLRDLEMAGKKVLIRVDVNVPLDENNNIADDSRIRAVLPTINYALDENAKVIIASHMGRPEGKVVSEFSLAPVAKRLSRLLQKDVQFVPDCIGTEVKAAVDKMQQGDVLLLENLGFILVSRKTMTALQKNWLPCAISM